MTKRINEVIRICFVCDENFLEKMMVTIGSILECRTNGDKYEVYVIGNGLSRECKERVLKLQKNDFRIVVIEGKLKQDFPQQIWAAHVSKSALLKFEMLNIFDKFDKMLYLDGDILVLKDIRRLYFSDIDGYYVAAVQDMRAFEDKQSIDADIFDKGYFNSGVMLLNLKKIREDGVYHKIIDYRINKKNTFMDQDAFNAGFKSRVKHLSLHCNAMISCIWRYEFNIIKEFYKLKENSICDLYKNVILLHFSSGIKPWDYYDIPFSNVWRMLYKKYVDGKINRNSISISSICEDYKLPYAKRDVAIESELIDKMQPMDEYNISVIMPVYNAKNYVEKSIRSVMRQTFRNFELIIVDDASTDGSYEVCSAIANRYSNVSLYKMKSNSGQGLARNEGISHAKGKYIAFLDADDEFLPTALEVLYEKAEYYSADVVSSVGWMWEKGHKVFNEDLSVEEELPEEFSARVKIFCEKKIPFEVWNKIYRKNFLDEEKIIFENVSPMEDMVYNTYCICLARNYVVIPDAVNFYCHTSVSSTRGNNKDVLRTAKRMRMFVDSASCLNHFFHSRGFADKYPVLCSQIKSFVIGQSMEFFFHMLRYFPEPLYSVNRDIPYDLEKAACKELSANMEVGQAWMIAFLMYEIIRYHTDEERKVFHSIGGQNEYVFPFHLFPPKAKVVVYGAGEAGKLLYRDGNRAGYLEIVGLVDKEYKERREGEFPVQGVDMLHHWLYDYVLIAIRDENVAMEVKEDLINMGIKPNKIKWDGRSYLKDEFYHNIYFKALHRMHEI